MTAGTFGGGTFGFPQLGGFGGGLHVDSHGNLYPQAYFGTPKLSLSSGYSPNLEEFLTGPSVSGGVGPGPIVGNFGMSATAPAIGFGTPDAGVTYGFGPYKLDPALSKPLAKSIRPYMRLFLICRPIVRSRSETVLGHGPQPS